ncbi:MAG: phosphatase PAP2 family protein, partial [Bacilli bacterium]
MRNFIQKTKPILVMLAIYPILGYFYGFLNVEPGNLPNLITPLDEMIPFVPEFVLPYVIWYPFLIVGIIHIYFKDKGLFYITIITDAIGRVACYVIYFFYQTTVPRPELVGNYIWTVFVRIIYANDN